MLFSIASVVIFIIMFTSIFCIRNSFAISITEKMKLYGMLASIGATKKQIKKNVIYEAFILALIGIPLGIISGILAIFILLKIVNALIGEYLLANVNGIIFNVTLMPIIVSIVLGFITIYLSAISSARKASKVNPIVLLRNSEEIKINAKSLKTPKIISKVFKQGGVLAYKNLKRSKKKYRTTVISLAVSICIFISMNAFFNDIMDFTGVYYTDYDYNIELSKNRNDEDVSDEDLNTILKLSNIDEKFLNYSTNSWVAIFDMNKVCDVPGYSVSEDSIYDKEEKTQIPTGRGKVIRCSIHGLDSNSFEQYCKKLGLNYNNSKDKAILCDEIPVWNEDDNTLSKQRRYTYKAGDILEGIEQISTKENGWVDKGKIELTIAAVSNIRPYGQENSYNAEGDLIVNKDEYPNFNFSLSKILVQSSNSEQFIKDFKNTKININYIDFEELARENKSMTIVVKIFLYGFMGVITLIGVTNIFNTITSNLELRQKEIAALKSIGMTKKEFNRMINLETIFYSFKALLYGIILGLLGTFAIHMSYGIKVQSENVYIPYIPILISIASVFILVFIIMRYSIRKINRQNTIETIRNDNI